MKKLIHKFLAFIGIPLCPGLGYPCFKIAKTRRLPTMYIDDKRNYIKTCEDCFIEACECYDV